LSGSVAKSAKGTPSVLTLNALQGILGTPSLNTTSVTITSAPNGSQGEAVTGTYVITFTYTAYGVTVAGSTITVTVT